MTPIKPRSLISEIMAWLFFSLAALVLALPLVTSRHQIRLADLSSPLFSVSVASAAVSDPNRPPAPAADSMVRSPADLVRLTPNPSLMGHLNQAPGLQPTWKAAGPAYDEMIEQTARQYQVSPILVKAVILAESNFNPRAVSQRGAVGLMQVMPATGHWLGVRNLSDPQANITAGVKYLKKLLILFNDDERLAVAAYNCGPEAMKRWDNQPPYKETIEFVDRVMAYYNHHLDG